MPLYKHTQPGTAMRLGLGAVIILMIVSLFVTDDDRTAAYVVLAALVAVLVLFWSLTVTVDAERVVAAFGPGLIRREIPVVSIRGVSEGRIAWYNGWGIRLTRSGWLYRVSGMHSVDVRLDHASFRIGTDDREGLMLAIQAAMDLHEPA